MATYTREDLNIRILGRLGVHDPGEEPDAADYKLINDGVQQKLEELYRKGWIPFDVDTDQIPARYFNALVGICAVNFIDDFSAYERTTTLASAQQAGTRTLQEFVEEAALGSPTQANYF